MAMTAGKLTVGKRSIDGSALLTIWVVVLLAVPANLVVAPLGAAGSPAQLIGLMAGAWWLGAQLERTRAAPGPRQPIKVAMLLFVGAICASYVVAASRPISDLELRAADRGLLIMLSWLGVLLLTTDGVTTRQRLDTILRSMVTVGGLVAFLGVLQFFTGSAFVDLISIPGLSPNSELTSIYARDGFVRAAGTSTHPIEFGVMLAMVLPIALNYAMADRHRSTLVRWFPVAAIAVAIPITISRSALIGVVVILAIVLPSWSIKARRSAYVGILTLLLVVYVAVPGLLGTLTRLFTGVGNDDSARSRTDSYDLAWQFIQTWPVFGRGVSTFLPEYRILDNQYLGLAIETGIVGLLAFLALLLTGILVGARLMRVASDPHTRSLSRSLVAAVSAAACAYATFDGFGFPQVSGLTFFFLGCLGALLRLESTERERFLAGQEPLSFLTARPSWVTNGR